MILKQSTAVDVLIGPFVDLTDGATAETGESPTVKLSKNGQALGAKNDATTPVHDADGYYNCELDDTDTGTVGTLVLTVAASANALPVRHEFQVVSANVYDSLYAAATTDYLQVDSIQLSGDATAADNLEAAYDGTGYDVGGLDVSEVNAIVDDWLNGGRLDLILDARASQATADAIETDTQDLQSRVPAALVGGRIDATVDATGMESGATGNIAAALKYFHISVSYASSVFQLTCWLTDGTGARVNVTTVGDIDVVDHALAAVIDDSASEWNTSAPTEGADNLIRAERDDTTPLLSAGEEYVVRATLDSVVYEAPFNLVPSA